MTLIGIPEPVAEPVCPRCDKSEWGLKYTTLGDRNTERDVKALVMTNRGAAEISLLKHEDWNTIAGMVIGFDVLFVYCRHCGFTASVTPILESSAVSHARSVRETLEVAKYTRHDQL